RGGRRPDARARLMHVVFPALLKFGDVGLLLLRLMVAVVFFASGLNHLKDPVARSRSIGASPRFTVFLGTTELLGSTAVALGILTQLAAIGRSEEHTSELQSRGHLVCRLLLEKKKKKEKRKDLRHRKSKVKLNLCTT